MSTTPAPTTRGPFLVGNTRVSGFYLAETGGTDDPAQARQFATEEQARNYGRSRSWARALRIVTLDQARDEAHRLDPRCDHVDATDKRCPLARWARGGFFCTDHQES